MTNQPDNTISRIQQMESYFDQLQHAAQTDSVSVHSDEALHSMLQALTDYYESGLWLEDYDRDAKGELPATLKRGVLSQDGVHDLLCAVSKH